MRMHRIGAIKIEDGRCRFKVSLGLVPVFKESLEGYARALAPLFEKAQKTCEFEFILTLLRVRGIEDAGWDAYENTEKAFNLILGQLKRIKDFETKRHLLLWLYGHTVEASEPYEIVANLINIVKGKRWNMNNFPDRVKGNYRKPLSVAEKIRKLERMAQDINMPEVISPFVDIFDRNLRNAVFHSDYSLFGDEVRIRDPVRVYSNQEITDLFNKAIAHFIVFSELLRAYIASYDKPKIIPVHPEFSRDPKEKTITIIREGYGLVGLKDNWTEDELKRGHIPFRVGRFHRYEMKMLDSDRLLTIIPRDRIRRINAALKLLPNFLRKPIVAKLEKDFL